MKKSRNTVSTFKNKKNSPATPKKIKKPLVSARVKTSLLKLAASVKKRRTNVAQPQKLPTVRLSFEQFIFDPSKLTRRYVKLSKPIEVINNFNETVTGPRTSDLPTQKWIDAQISYLKNLNNYDLHTAMSYTVRSHEWIGRWMRGRNNIIFKNPPTDMVSPLFPQVMSIINRFNSQWALAFMHVLQTNPNEITKFYKKYINDIPDDILNQAMILYYNDLHRIIRNAPPLDKSIIVYRGLDKEFQGANGTLSDFSSTSYVPRPDYARRMYVRIKLLKGIRVLLLQALNTWNSAGEFEILLNAGSKYILRKRNLTRSVMNRNNNTENKMLKKQVTDITLIK
jgi:hypothetical protein